LLSPTAKDVYTPVTKRQKMAENALDTHKPIRRTLNMDPVAAEQTQQQEHVVLLEEQVVLLEEHDEGVDDYNDLPHNYDDNPLDVPPIPPLT
jgi:hypothetical protein